MMRHVHRATRAGSGRAGEPVPAHRRTQRRSRDPRRFAIPFFAVVAQAIGCGQEASEPWHDEGYYRWTALRVRGAEEGGFTQLSVRRTGIEFVNNASPDEVLENRHLAHGSGVALGDVDGDGLLDIFLARIDGPNALYRNLGDWRFEEIAELAGVAAPDRYSTGAAFADVNGNGHLDLIVTALGGPNALFLNDGSGRFTEQVREAGLQSNRASTTLAMADVDGSGYLDLYIANYKLATVRDLYPPQARAFDQVIRRRGDDYEVAPEFSEHYRESGVDALGRLVRVERADPDWFYRNDGSGRFQAVPFTSGRFRDEDGRPYEQEPDYFGLVARFYDVNGDGHPDLYVANDFSGPDQLWLNDGSGNFHEAPSLALRSTSHSSMAVDFADIDRDGTTDFFVVDMLAPRESPRWKTQTPTNTPMPKRVGEIENRPQVQRNSLYLNRGDGTFAQIAHLAGLEASEWSWSTLFMDVDLDGYEDILVTTGHLWDVMDSDTHERLATSFPNVAWRSGLLEFPPLAVRNFAFRNRGDLTFEDASRRWGFGREDDISHGMAAGDLDGDGDLDVVVNRFGAPAAVFRNDAGAPRIAVRLAGSPPNTQGVGAKVRVEGGPVALQQREITIGGLYLSSSEPMLTFATGTAERVAIEVVWRNGDRTVIPDARPDRLYEIRQVSTAAPENEMASLPDGSGSRFAWGDSPLFADRSAELDHSHADGFFDDFARQPLLPNRLSQLGPGVSLYDVDRDGYEDLLVASGRGGALSHFRNHGGRLVPVSGSTSPTAFDQTTILGMPDGSGGTAILVGQASYEAATLPEALALPSVLRIDGLGTADEPRIGAAVPGDTSVAGPLALADVSGNGELDLFVGGRVLPAAYPLAASSRFYLNAGGRFEHDPVNSATFASIGLVSAALFSDIDGDGAADLILAMEWGPIRVFLNRGGQLVEATESLGLADYSSRWNGVATGDLDGDGRLDIIATSWGRNTDHGATRTNPLYLYHADFDGNGILDVILAQFDGRVEGIAPLTTRARLLTAIPSLAPRIRSFEDYANATIEEALGTPFERARRLEANTFDHMLFLNRGDTFDAVPLPLDAQIAPAFYIGVADFDGDGNEDVFLSQNFFATEITSQRFDAGRGLLLLGDGAGGLAPVPGHASGIKVYGEQRGAAFGDLDADGRTDLVVSQNGASKIGRAHV